MFSYKMYEQAGEKLLAVCDEDALGKTFGSGDLEIEVSDFYRGSICGPTEILKITQKSTIINAVGNEIVKLLIKNKLVDKSSILTIGGVMHAQVVAIV